MDVRLKMSGREAILAGSQSSRISIDRIRTQEHHLCRSGLPLSEQE